MKKLLILILTFAITLAAPLGHAQTFFSTAQALKDIDRHWAEDSIQTLKDMGIMNGYDGYAYPGNIITRGEFTALIARAFDLETTKSTSGFSDVGNDHIFFNSICAASDAGIIDGFPDRTFRPGNMITREEIMLILSRLRPGGNTTPADFTDIDSGYKYYSQLSAISTDGIINGYPDGSFGPHNKTTRAEAASMILSAMKKYIPSGNRESITETIKNYLPVHFANDFQAGSMLTGQAGIDRNYIDYAYSYSNMLGYTVKNEISGLFVSSLEQDGPFSQITAEYYVTRSINGSKMRYYKGKSEISVLTRNNINKIFSHDTYIVYENPINLTWEIFSSPPDYDMPGVNVVSPTSFVVSASKEYSASHILGADKKGNIHFNSSLNEKYIRWAKEKNYDLWVMYKTDFTTETANRFLNNPDMRLKSVNTLIDKILYYDLEGINFDFENMLSADRGAYTNHVREVSLISHVLGACVSVDVTVFMPTSLTWSMCYDRDALARYSDYIILMAYDQYYSGSSIPGPVAGIKWTAQITETTLNEVKAERLILGMPFYIRCWETKNGKTVSSKALSMAQAVERVDANNATATFDSDHGITKYSWTESGKDYVLWMENAESIKKRAEISNQYGLAGVASWRRGFETQDIWDAIREGLNL